MGTLVRALGIRKLAFSTHHRRHHHASYPRIVAGRAQPLEHFMLSRFLKVGKATRGCDVFHGLLPQTLVVDVMDRQAVLGGGGAELPLSQVRAQFHAIRYQFNLERVVSCNIYATRVTSSTTYKLSSRRSKRWSVHLLWSQGFKYKHSIRVTKEYLYKSNTSLEVWQ